MEAFLVSTGVIALGEMGDKTQIVTAALLTRYRDLFPVALVTTLCMKRANVPAVFRVDV